MKHWLYGSIAIAAMLLSAPLHAGINDTGQGACYNDSAADVVAATSPMSISADAGSHPRQDCRYGRDAAAAAGKLAKTGAGKGGFDYSKIANDGSVLPPGAALGSGPGDWACTLDNISGLMWEVKVNDTNHLRHYQWTYTWYDPNSAANGGNAGFEDAGPGIGTDGCLDNARCDTEKFVADVNTSALCGYTDWRMPSKRELHTLSHFGTGTAPYYDTDYFPNLDVVFSSTSYVADTSRAWIVYFGLVGDDAAPKSSNMGAWLVRGGRF